MKGKNFQEKVINATKWSIITQIAAKIISPLTNMILARILAPEAFGVVATVTIITSFAEMLTDAGFQKYLVQHEFRNEEEKEKNANVAFITNFAISILLWGLIIIFSEQIAVLVGNPGLGKVIAIAGIQLPLTAFFSIQMALYRRNFDFKTLFMVRMVSIFIPFVVTIPLALIGLNYWALIIGTIFMHLSNAVILTIKSRWKPNLFFSLSILKEMLTFSIWSLIEAVSIWLTIWIDTFIISSLLSEHYLGLYKTSTIMVNALMALITASVVPVLFSTLSRLQNDTNMFNLTYFKMQRLVSVCILPLGIGVFLFSDLATEILLGKQWIEASKVIGIWALTSSIMIPFGHFCSEAYRAKGRPKLSFVGQVLHLVVLVPTCLISIKYGFWIFVYARSWVRMQYVIVHFILMKVSIGIPVFQTIKNVFPSVFSAVVMGLFGYLLQQFNDGLLWSFLSIMFCALIYFAVLAFFPSIRQEINVIGKKLFTNRRK